jgi:hypothetical protein
MGTGSSEVRPGHTKGICKKKTRVTLIFEAKTRVEGKILVLFEFSVCIANKFAIFYIAK